MNLLLVSLTAAAIVGWSGSTAEAAKWPEKNGVPCACTRLNDPVCGDDGQDYPNPQCAKYCGGVSYRHGQCAEVRKNCQCTLEGPIVCASSPGGTPGVFINRCYAECINGLTVINQGHCGNDGIIPRSSSGLLNAKRSMNVVNVKKSADIVCKCPRMYVPVCGLKDDKWISYANQCFADCYGAERTRWGECNPNNCACPDIYAPVCARTLNGTLKVYDSRCEADCEEAIVTEKKLCGIKPLIIPYRQNLEPAKKTVKKLYDDSKNLDLPPCVCTREYNPVCGLADGEWKTFSTGCMARCHGAERWKMGRCGSKALCPCHQNLDYTCARRRDGLLQVYGNGCAADCDEAIILPKNKCGIQPYFISPPVDGPEETHEDSLPCYCTHDYAPVCAFVNGEWKDFPNPCLARCAESSVLLDIPCNKASQLPTNPYEKS